MILWTLGLLGLLLTGWTMLSARRMLHPKAKAPVDPHPPSGLRTDSIPTHDGARLPLWIYDAPQPRGLLLACHGLYANQRQVHGVAQSLARRGYTVISFDWRGHGARAGRCTYGRDEVPDLITLLDWARAQPAWASLPVGAIGWSFGGAISCQLAARRPDVRALVTDATYARLFPLVAWLIRRDYRLPAVPFAHLTWWGAQALLRYRLDRVEPVVLAARLRQPLLAIHGTADQTVPVAHAHALYAAWQGPKQQWLVPGAGHVGSFDAHPEAYLQRVVEFCDRMVS